MGSSMYHDGTGDWLESPEAVQDNALISSVFVPSEVVRCFTSAFC
jgi:hypothetical protein